jgi:hypothetical protein
LQQTRSSFVILVLKSVYSIAPGVVLDFWDDFPSIEPALAPDPTSSRRGAPLLNGISHFLSTTELDSIGIFHGGDSIQNCAPGLQVDDLVLNSLNGRINVTFFEQNLDWSVTVE